MLALAPHFEPVPSPSPLPVSRLSYSSLASYARCGYRFHLERVAGLHANEDIVPGADEQGADMSALARGRVVHELLEHMDMSRAARPSADEVTRVMKAHDLAPSFASGIEAMLDAFARSEIRARLGNARSLRVEVPFAFNLDRLLINGYLDVLAVEADRTLVLDYKSDALDGRDPAELIEARYTGQRTVYALAALRSGADQVEVAYSFLERPDDIASASFTRADIPALEERVQELAAGLVAGRFEPSPSPGADLCAGCPGRVALCSWPEERTLA
jgi:ATP-dependent helicase/nuclease subunit A